MTTKNFPNIVNLARKMSEKSEMRYKLGTVIFKNNNVINTGYNRWLLMGRKEVKPFRTSIHAEEDAIIGCSRKDLYNASILIYRRNCLNAFPCHCCMKTIITSGIKHIWYSKDGKIEYLRL